MTTPVDTAELTQDPKNPEPAGSSIAFTATLFRSSMLHDFLHAGGFLVVGAAAAATLNVVVPRQ